MSVYVETLPSGTVTVSLAMLPNGAAQLDFDFAGISRRYLREPYRAPGAEGRSPTWIPPHWFVEQSGAFIPVHAERVPDAVRQAWVKMAHIMPHKVGA